MEKISIDMLTANNVVIQKETFTEINGQTISLGVHRQGFDNSKTGRESAQENIPEPYLSAVLLIWGNEPTL
ncbi:MAG: hypothetical protein LC100_06220 [Chitinophagales bacterium]|nr:hypothetical protein [Chitinophagales bacterium]